MNLSKQLAEAYKGPAHPGSIGALELNQILEEGIRAIQIVDVRPLKEHRAMRLAGSLPIPLSEMVERSAQLRDAQAGECGRLIVVYCRSGVSSRKACAILRDNGFSDAR